MRDHAAGAIFYSVFQDFEVSSALCALGIKRTVAEKAVKVICIFCLVAREVFTIFIGEETGTVFHFIFLSSAYQDFYTQMIYYFHAAVNPV